SLWGPAPLRARRSRSGALAGPDEEGERIERPEDPLDREAHARRLDPRPAARGERVQVRAVARPQIHAVARADRIEDGALREAQRRHERLRETRGGRALVEVRTRLLPVRHGLDVSGRGEIALPPAPEVVGMRRGAEADVGPVVPVAEVVPAHPP